jgi:hypothetical protein
MSLPAYTCAQSSPGKQAVVWMTDDSDETVNVQLVTEGLRPAAKEVSVNVLASRMAWLTELST